jgi:hypothetical protein
MGGGGAIVRTAAHGAKRADFERELMYLHKLHEVLVKRADEAVAPDMVFQEADLSVRVVRDIFSADFDKAIIDDDKQHQRLSSFFTRTGPELVDSIELYDGKEPLFEKYGVEEVIEGLMDRRVDLPSGGYLIINYAEALTVIDVNSARSPAAARAPAWRTRSCARTSRRPRRSSTSCACATSAGSSSSTSSTWPAARNRNEVLKTCASRSRRTARRPSRRRSPSSASSR